MTIVESITNSYSGKDLALGRLRAATFNVIVFDYNAYPEFILDACEVVLLGLEICQGEVVSLTCVIFARYGSLDMKYGSIFTADEYALRNLVTKV